MDTRFEGKLGAKLPTFIFKVELGKIREFAIAIGDESEAFMSGERVPPTFATVMIFSRRDFDIIDFMALNPKKVLHGEQEYEYIGPISAGDEITITGEIEEIYTKAAMNFIVWKKQFKNQHGDTVLISRHTTIERH